MRPGQLDRQREPVDAPADLRDSGRGGIVQVEVGVVGVRSCAEQRDCVDTGQRVHVLGRRARGQRERRHRVALLGVQSERFPTCGEHRERGTGIEEPGDERRCRKHVLEVVGDQQQLLGG